MQVAVGRPRERLCGWTGISSCANTTGHRLAVLPKLPGAGGYTWRPKKRQTCSWEGAEMLWGWIHRV